MKVDESRVTSRVSDGCRRDLLLQLPSAYAFFDFRGCNIDPEARQALRDLLPEAFSASIVF